MGDNLNFICTTKNKRFTIGYWTSREYIGSTGQQLEFGSRQQLNQTKNSTIDDSTFATLVAAYEENGLTVLKIKLQFTVSVAAEFICGIEGHEKNITLILGKSVKISLCIILYSRKIWRFGGLYYNHQIKIRQHFLLAYIHMAIPYRTAKFKSANILPIAILGSTAKFNSRQCFRLYGTSCLYLHVPTYTSVYNTLMYMYLTS